MRIQYSNLEIAKSVAKRVARLTGLQLGVCQAALAKASGYADWHELSIITHRESASCPGSLALDELAALIADLATELGSSAGDIQHALSHTPLLQPDAVSLSDRVHLRALVFRRMEIPEPGRRQPGAVGKFKHDRAPLILQRFGGLTFGVSDGSPSSVAMADFEFVTPRTPLPLFIPSRLYLAYGCWTEADGAKVLFSRDYIPLWRIRSGRSPERLSPRLWIDFTDQQWFWGDHNPPWEKSGRHRTEIDRLTAYGIRGVPKLVEMLPARVFGESNQRIREIAEEVFGPWVYNEVRRELALT